VAVRAPIFDLEAWKALPSEELKKRLENRPQLREKLAAIRDKLSSGESISRNMSGHLKNSRERGDAIRKAHRSCPITWGMTPS
jgi:hypothetical protein